MTPSEGRLKPASAASAPVQQLTSAEGQRLISRRALLAGAFVLPIVSPVAGKRGSSPSVIIPRPTDVRIVSVDHQFEEFGYRVPYQFGGRTVDRVTILNVNCRVRTRGGREAWGFGSMTLGNAWAFPAVPHDVSIGAMIALASELESVSRACDAWGHPIDLFRALEPQYLAAAAALSRGRNLPVAVPKLCTLVVASPFDAALHDAYGKAFDVSSYATYGREFMGRDLAQDLGPSFSGEFLDRYVPLKPRAGTPVFHSVGASDPLEAGDVRTRIDDGLPNTLEEWIARDGVTRFKIKLNGGNLDADVERIVRVDRVVNRALTARRAADWRYLLDFNEGCPNVAYLLEVLERVRATTRSGFDRILYIEQPTARDLQSDRGNVMHEAAKLHPVVIDESLTDLDALLLARDMGYTGVALKACKGQSHALLMAAAAQKFGMFLCVQDLTCPGASLIHSAGIAARVPGNAGIEANARQFVPAASAAWEPRFPGLFTIRDGMMATGQLTGPGLGAVPPRPV
jgi:L-alanine-DL-glutamate epimerase-like enolase superfamily enzyme